MMSDLDKDIDRLKELQSTIYEGGDYIYLNKNDKQALGNVLWALNGKDCVIETQSHNEEVLEEYIAKLEKELDTYKKVAEKLAERVKKESILDSNCYVNGLKICKGNKDCQQCILDWARKEVENEQKNT